MKNWPSWRPPRKKRRKCDPKETISGHPRSYDCCNLTCNWTRRYNYIEVNEIQSHDLKPPFHCRQLFELTTVSGRGTSGAYSNYPESQISLVTLGWQVSQKCGRASEIKLLEISVNTSTAKFPRSTALQTDHEVLQALNKYDRTASSLDFLHFFTNSMGSICMFFFG